MPSGKQDVVGLMTGAASFDWPSSQSTILPGAICEHLTSFGGALSEGNGQTPLTEFLRYGAAGASGTIVEPYAIQDKFPLADIQVHYARGCSLAESFYQSVFGPYQLLIVGDPLCQPWATPPNVLVSGIKPDEVVSGKITISASSKDDAADRFQFFVDGQRIGRRPAGAPLVLDTTSFSDGFHYLSIVGTAANDIETQGRLLLPVTFDNLHHRVEITADKTKAHWNEPFSLIVKTPGLKGGIVVINGVAISQFEGEDEEVSLDSRVFGSGPIKVMAIGLTNEKPQKAIIGKPLAIEIEPNLALPPLPQNNRQRLTRGLKLMIATGQATPVQETRSADWLSKAGVKPNERYGLDGYFTVPPIDRTTVAAKAADVAAQGVHQFQIRYTGDLKIAVDNTLLHEGADGKDQQIFLPIALAPGMHRLRVSGTAGERVKLQIRYGGEGTRSLDGEQFRQFLSN